MKLRVRTAGLVKETQSGILYLLEFKLEDRKLVKIGVTTRDKVEHRVCEVLTEIWKRYRIFPECYVKRHRKVENVYEKEAALHRHFADHQYCTKFKFGGCTEFFSVDLDEVVLVYDDITG